MVIKPIPLQNIFHEVWIFAHTTTFTCLSVQESTSECNLSYMGGLKVENEPISNTKKSYK
jgi:hypothetical protein